MKLLVTTTDYTITNKLAQEMQGDYNKPVIYHCYWNGELNEKHYYSILSCYYFNVHKRGHTTAHKIILWLENNTPNQYNKDIEKYAEVRYFSLREEIDNAGFINGDFYYKKELSFYSDVVRYLLLYNYGGVWFDLDCFFLRSFDPIFTLYGNEICVYQWESQNYPNGAVFISLERKSEKMKQNIEFIINRNRGWGFQEAALTYDLPLDLLVLPCSWFDASWIGGRNFSSFFRSNDKQYNFDNFYKGSFCYHWHNQWRTHINDNSIIMQLVKIIMSDINGK
jgi:hypothetical protein